MNLQATHPKRPIRPQSPRRDRDPNHWHWHPIHHYLHVLPVPLSISSKPRSHSYAPRTCCWYNDLWALHKGLIVVAVAGRAKVKLRSWSDGTSSMVSQGKLPWTATNRGICGRNVFINGFGNWDRQGWESIKVHLRAWNIGIFSNFFVVILIVSLFHPGTPLVSSESL